MKSRFTVLFTAAFLAAVATSSAAITVTSSGTAPTTTADDQFYLPGNVSAANSRGTGNDAGTYVATDRPSKGMSFTTGSNAGGYALSSISVQHVFYGGTFFRVNPTNGFEFNFGTISGTTKSILLASTTATYTGTGFSGNNVWGTGNFLTFDLSGESLATLAANTEYYFELAPETGDPFIELNSTDTSGYAGGQAFTGGTNATINTAVNAQGGDFAFVAKLTAIPEPSSAALVLGAIGSLALLRRRN